MQNINARLDHLTEDGTNDEFFKISILDMSERVLANLAASYENIPKGVRSVVSGRVLDYEAKRIRNEGYTKGFKEGEETGVINTLISLVKDGILTIKDAATRAGITETAFQQKMAAM